MREADQIVPPELENMQSFGGGGGYGGGSRYRSAGIITIFQLREKP